MARKTMIVSYDLNKGTREEYDELYKLLQSFEGWAKITESCWYINSTSNCTVVRDELLSAMDSNDRLFVAALEGSAAWNNIIGDSSYVKNQLKNEG